MQTQCRTPRGSQRGFSLIEISLVLVIAGLALGAGLAALGPQLEQRKYTQAQEKMADAADAILGFAVLNRRLPCPASAATNGLEAMCTTVTGACTVTTTMANFHGRCANPNNGFIPGATLGLRDLGPVGTPAHGRVVDAWALPLRYAVSHTIQTVTATTSVYALTAHDGLRSVMLSGTPLATVTLRICAEATGATASECGAGQEIVRPAFVLWTAGRNGTASSGADETLNLNNTPVFVSRPRVDTFDDVLQWYSTGTVTDRLNRAGLLSP